MTVQKQGHPVSNIFQASIKLASILLCFSSGIIQPVQAACTTPPPPVCTIQSQFLDGKWDFTSVNGQYSLSGNESREGPWGGETQDWQVDGDLTVTLLGGKAENYIEVDCNGTVTGKGHDKIEGTYERTVPGPVCFDSGLGHILCPLDGTEEGYQGDLVDHYNVTIDRTYDVTGQVTANGTLEITRTITEGTLDVDGDFVNLPDWGYFQSGSQSFQKQLGGEIEEVRLSGNYDEASGNFSPIITDMGSGKHWIRQLLEQDYFDPSAPGDDTYEASWDSSQPFIQAAGSVEITLDIDMQSDAITPVVEEITLDEPEFYLTDVDIETTATIKVDWRSASPDSLEITYGGQTETISATGDETQHTFELGDSGDTMDVVAIAGDERSESFPFQLKKVAVPGWAGSSSDWTGNAGVQYDGLLHWPFSLETTQTVSSLSVLSGLWGVSGSVTSDMNLVANSNGSAGTGDMTSTASLKLAGKEYTLTLEGGTNDTTLSCDELTMTGNTTVTFPSITWSESITPFILIPGLQSSVCALSSIACSTMNSVGVKVTVGAGLNGDADYESKDSKIEFTGGSLTGSIFTTASASAGVVLPKPFGTVLNASISGTGTGCITINAAPEFSLDELGGNLNVTATASAMFLGSTTASKDWPYGAGCSSGDISLLFAADEAAVLVPSTTDIPLDSHTSLLADDINDAVVSWSQVPAGIARPAGDIVIRLKDADGWGETLPITQDAVSSLAPALAHDINGHLMIVFQRNGTQPLPTELAQLDTFSDGFELHYALFDKSTKTVIESGALTDNDHTDFGAYLRIDNMGQMHLFWQTAIGADYAGSDGNSISILTRHWDGTTWSATQVVGDSLNAIIGWQPAVHSNDEQLITLIKDTDADLMSSDDQEVAIIRKQAGAWQPLELLTDDMTMDHSALPAFTNDGQPVVFWGTSDRVLGLIGDLNVIPAEIVPAAEVVSSALGHGEIRANSNGLALLWSDGNKLRIVTNLEMNEPGGGTWSLPVEVFPSTTNDRLMSFSLDNDNRLLLGYASQNIPAGLSTESIQLAELSPSSCGEPFQTDSDADGAGDSCDNCPIIANSDQLDNNANDIGNACEVTTVIYNGINIVLSAAVETLSEISAITGDFPANMLTPYGKISYRVTSPDNGTAAVRISFSTTLPAAIKIFQLNNTGAYVSVPKNSGTDGYWEKIDANTLEISLKDNGAFDLNNALGIIDAGIVPGTLTNNMPAIFLLLD